MDAARAALLRLLIDAAQTPRVRIIARNAGRDRRPTREAGERLLPGVLEEAHAERPQGGLRRIAHKPAGAIAVVAVPVPAPCGQVDRVPWLPVVPDSIH